MLFFSFQEISSKIDQNKDIIEQNNRNFNEMKKQRDALQNERKYVHVRYSHDDPLTVVLLLESAGFVTMIESKEMSSFFSPPLPVYYGGKKHYYNKNYRVQEKN